MKDEPPPYYETKYIYEQNDYSERWNGAGSVVYCMIGFIIFVGFIVLIL